MASLLCHKRRTARQFTAQRAFGTMVWPSPPPGVRPPRISRPTPFGPRLRKAAAVRSTSRGLHSETSSRRLVFVPSDPLEQLSGALVMASSQKVEPRPCTVVELKPMAKLITFDKYLSVRQNQGLTQSSDSNVWEN